MKDVIDSQSVAPEETCSTDSVHWGAEGQEALLDELLQGLFILRSNL